MTIIASEDAEPLICASGSEASFDTPFNSAEWAQILGPDFEAKVERSLRRVRRKLIIRSLLRRERLRIEVLFMQALSGFLHSCSRVVSYSAKLARPGS